MPKFPNEIEYSEKFTDDLYEYRHVILPREIYNTVNVKRILIEVNFIFLARMEIIRSLIIEGLG